MITDIGSRVIQRLVTLQEEAIIDLIGVTGFNVHAYNLKGQEGARRAIERINEEGYVILQLEEDNEFRVSYILQRDGETIARRDVEIMIKAGIKRER